MRRALAVLTIASGLFVGLSAQAHADQRYALVIGNADYTHVTPLRNPINDARDMAAALERDGFTVNLLIDATRDETDQGAIELANQLSQTKSSIGFFYYAGHGVQMNGTNYLIPVNADIPAAGFLSERAEALQSILNVVGGAGNKLNIFVLDACRDNPFSWSRGLSRGLTVVGHQPAGSIIAYAAAAGQVAEDGSGANGIYTGELLRYLDTRGMSVSKVFRETGGAVSAATGGAQTPATYNQFYGQVYLAGAPQAASVAPNITQPPTQTPPVNVAANVRQPPPVNVAANVTQAPPGMVLVQGGTFTMGDTFGGGTSDEKPLHQVTLSSFYMAKTEVTQAEFQSVMGFNPSYFRGENLPVERVTWYDAVAWCNAKSRQEGLQEVYSISNVQKNGNDIVSADVTADWAADGYRLPTEAEWEYAAKGGNESRGYDYAGSNNVNQVAWDINDSGNTTHPVAQKQPNELGLYDMSGNVWEWCWDWYGSYTSASETNPHGPASGQYRVLRGGSWGLDVGSCRSSVRLATDPNLGGGNGGFRPVRPLP